MRPLHAARVKPRVVVPHRPRRMPPSRLPQTVIYAYTRLLLDLQRRATRIIRRCLRAEGVDLNASIQGEQEGATGEHGSIAAALDRAETQIQGLVAHQVLAPQLDRLGKRVAEWTERQLKKQLEAARGEAPEELPPITSLVVTWRERTLGRLRELLGRRVERLRAQLVHRTDAKDDTIHDAVAAGADHGESLASGAAEKAVLELNAATTEQQHRDAGIEEYIWRAHRSSRPRHKDLNGQRFRYDDPPIYDPRTGRKGNPGEDYNCKCVAEPILGSPSEILATSAAKIPAALHWSNSDSGVIVREKQLLYWNSAKNIAADIAEALESHELRPAKSMPKRDELPDQPVLQAEMSNLFEGKFKFVDRDKEKKCPTKIHVVKQELLSSSTVAAEHSWDGVVSLSPQVAQLVVSGLKKTEDNKRDELTGDEVSAIRTLVHEYCHAHSPRNSGAYCDNGIRIEEATNELVARKVTRESLGIDSINLAVPPPLLPFAVRPYDKYILATARVVGSYLCLDDSQAIDLIEAAAIRLKQEAGKKADTPGEFIAMFVDKIDIPKGAYAGRGASESRVKDLRTRMVESLLKKKNNFDSNKRNDLMGMNKKRLTDVCQLDRNDVDGAMEVFDYLYTSGTLSGEEPPILCMLQDDSTEIRIRMHEYRERKARGE